MASGADDGHAPDTSQAAQWILRGDRIGTLHSVCDLAWVAGSTTHVVAGAIAGVGSIQRVRAVRWNVASDIVSAWILTIPAAGLFAALVFLFIRLLDPAV